MLIRHPKITLLSDEIYEKLIYPEIDPEVRHYSLGSMPELAERTITVNGLSKAFAMTGWRIGYLATPSGGGEFAANAGKLHSQMVSSVPSFCMPPIIEALDNGSEAVESMRAAFAKRGSLLALGPELQYTGEKAADPIEIRVYDGADATFTLYEDDGVSSDSGTAESEETALPGTAKAGTRF